jgi:hypothetical protein
MSGRGCLCDHPHESSRDSEVFCLVRAEVRESRVCRIFLRVVTSLLSQASSIVFSDEAFKIDLLSDDVDNAFLM